MVHIWVPVTDPLIIRAGVAREQAEQAATASADYLEAPPCPACGRPVKDSEWERHRRIDHADNEVAQPAGVPDARELMLLAYDTDDMERKLSRWRQLHPGIRLEPAGDGTRENGRIIFRRWRIFDGKGKAAE